MTARPNRRPGFCHCGTAVRAGAGTLIRRGGRWQVLCPDHPAAPSPAVDEPPAAPPAEVRYTGTLTECAALIQALKLAPHMQVTDVSEPRPRREEPGRHSVYAAVRIDPRLLAAVAREEAQE